ncbi:MAG: gluconate 2-dehydrogenase subunit 3 family protein [Armatimonadota bacterium]
MNHVDVSLPAGSVPNITVAPSPPESTVLSALQLTTLAAATDRIIPPDTYGPGGAAGGSLRYIVRHLEDGGNLVAFRSEYRAFLDALAGIGFSSLDAATQDEILSRIERSDTASQKLFFRLFAEHAQEGYYTSPENWSSIGFTVTG